MPSSLSLRSTALSQLLSLLFVLLALPRTHARTPDYHSARKTLLLRPRSLLDSEVQGALKGNISAEHALRKLLFTPVSVPIWDSPYSPSQTNADLFLGVTFRVIVYQVPPFVNIEDPEAAVLGDPGNVKQKRNYVNGKISGLVIDLLEQIKTLLNCEIEYYYPCRASDTTCSSSDFTSSTAALQMLAVDSPASSLFHGGGADLCPNYNCLVGGNVKISEENLRNFFFTQPFLQNGFVLVARSGEAEPRIMSWADPMTSFVWTVVIIELIVVGLGLCFTEGYGFINSLSEFRWSPLRLLVEGMYWSLLQLFGAATRSPVTVAGKILLVTQLFFKLLLISTYTGNLNSFLSTIPTSTKVQRIEDFFRTTKGFSKSNSICVPVENPSVQQYLNLLSDNNPDFQFQQVNGTTVDDCLMAVYLNKATATLYDQPVVVSKLASSFYQNSLCGNVGGYCVDNNLTSVPAVTNLSSNVTVSINPPVTLEVLGQDSCICPERDAGYNCINKNNYQFVSVQGSLVTVGELFNNFGYGLAFRRSSDAQALKYTTFNQAILYLQELGILQDIISQWLPDGSQLVCPGSGQGAVTLQLKNVSGLFLFTACGILLGTMVGLGELFVKFCIACFYCCKELKQRVEAEIQDYQDMIKREQGISVEPELSEHGKFVQNIVDTLDETKDKISEIESILRRFAK